MERETQNNTTLEEVVLRTLNLKDLLEGEYKLKIPDYQRIYCWEEKHVMRLLHDLNQRSHKEFHLGTIILHKKDENSYDIVDGQQRMVTLVLILLHLNKSNNSLADEYFESKEAQSYIAYNKYLIQNYFDHYKISKEEENVFVNNLMENIKFSVLVIQNASLDLAYTFFSTENSKGKNLTDFDLLKSHHLRFVYRPEQAEHLAERWDNHIRNSNNGNVEKPLGRTLTIYLFRLRKWMRKKNWDEWENRKIKNHFEAAPIVADIPPFGEQFHFYDSIQGGPHFFAYADYFVQKFEEYEKLTFYKAIHEDLKWEKHYWYRDVIETITFGYYLKFGQTYIIQAFTLIVDIVSYHRYSVGRANFNSIINYINETEILLMLDQATSPTFFLAEMQLKLETLKKYDLNSLSGTIYRYAERVNNIKKSLQQKEILDDEE